MLKKMACLFHILHIYFEEKMVTRDTTSNINCSSHWSACQKESKQQQPRFSNTEPDFQINVSMTCNYSDTVRIHNIRF